MSRVPPENQRVDEDVPPENEGPPVDEVGGIPQGFERLTAGTISLSVGVTELASAATYILPNGTRNGQEKILVTPVSGPAHDFTARVSCAFYKGRSAAYDTVGHYIALTGPMVTLQLKWTVGVPTESFGTQDLWVITNCPGVVQLPNDNDDMVSQTGIYQGASPS